MDRIDPQRLDLAAEFKANPAGPHSQDLQHLMKLLRWAPATSRYVAVQLKTNGPWYLALTTPPKTAPVKIFTGIEFTTEDEANWTVFRKRWAEHTGTWLKLAPDDCDDPTELGWTDSTGLVRRPLLGYASEFHVHHGQKLDFKVSCETPGHYEASLIRLRSGDHDVLGHKSTQIESSFDGQKPARIQPVHYGSWIDIDPHPRFASRSFAFTAWIWPTLAGDGEQAIAGTLDATTNQGFALLIDENARLTLALGDGEKTTRVSVDTALINRQWYLISVSYDHETGSANVAQCPLLRFAINDTAAEVTETFESRYQPAAGLRLAALGDAASPSTPWGSPAARLNYNGKLENPMLWTRCLSDEEFSRR